MDTMYCLIDVRKERGLASITISRTTRTATFDSDDRQGAIPFLMAGVLLDQWQRLAAMHPRWLRVESAPLHS